MAKYDLNALNNRSMTDSRHHPYPSANIFHEIVEKGYIFRHGSINEVIKPF